ncbi:hypothetical protein HDE68_004472 [Pedobacter cryoconitis]|uniref:Uncharacterized protein n=1 Tax=Pedobacter cryoconitis TaxID=188932 RepID=A0A7W8ZRC5_9SPHI|nr:hypothetical protein [Pedobacter cryoconitis]MBB5638540.1 hypothetical protein [Pedobacter cryoconitis]
MEVAITVLENEIRTKSMLLKKEDLMRKDIKQATLVMKDISKLKTAVKLLKDHHQRKERIRL